MLRYFILLLLISLFSPVWAQLKLDTLAWRSPLDIPIYLSGNFAELRSDHFHAGLDFKTQGKEGFKVYAVQDGYISRIKVSPSGYGKAIYITHTDGYTSVYGHLSEYNIQIDRYARDEQYKEQSYSIDVFPTKGEIPVKKGDIIGLSGNSGSSGGPHLHFEIRDAQSHTLNGLFLGYEIEDNLPPVMYHLYAYPQGLSSRVNAHATKQVYGLQKLNGHYSLKQGDTLHVNGEIGFGLKVDEYLNNSQNRCGIYYLNLFVDGELYMQQEYDRFSFAETRGINSLMDYEENVTLKRKLYKMYKEPNNNLSIYKKATNRGIVKGNKGEIKKILVEAVDAYGNKSELIYYLRFKGPAQNNIANIEERIVIPWQDEFSLDTAGFKVNFPPKAFYDTLNLSFNENNKRWPGTFSSVYTLSDNTIPVHKYFDIQVPVDSVDSELFDKLILTQIVEDKYIAVGGLYVDGYLKAKVRNLGKYVVLLDTIAPVVKPLGDIATQTDISDLKSFKFIIDDEFSGISGYEGTINGNWVLFEWDPKSKMLTYNIDEYLPKEGYCELELKVYDGRGNETIFKKEYEIFSEPDHDIGQ